MNKKKLLTMVLALVLIGAVGVGATLAYFTDKADVKNVVTMGHVDIDIIEPHFEGGEKGGEVTDIVPGQIIPKDPTIIVDADSQDAYIRAKIELRKLDKDGKETLWTKQQADELLAGIKINDGWFLAKDGYYYYKEVVKANTKIELFHEVVISEKWGNEVAGAKFAINVSAEAIQADSFKPTVENGMITAWKYSDGTAITAETYVAPTTPSADNAASDSVDTPVGTPTDTPADTQ